MIRIRNRRVLAAILVGVGAAAVVACKDTNDDDSNSKPNEEPVPGSGTGPAGSVPTFDTDGGGGLAPPPSDGAPPTFDFDAAAAEVPPLGSNQRGLWAVDDKRHLIRVLAGDPSSVIDVAPLDLPQGEQIIGMDFRPSNGMLYAITTASRIYTIDRPTAKATAVGTAQTTPLMMGQAFGVDFNPVADLLRVHSDVDQNLRINPTTGAVAGADKALVFGPDDVHFRQSPNLIGSAYTNSVAGATTTVLYAIDSTRNLLTKVAPPNEGVVITVGELGVDIIANAGFDIWGTDGSLEAYAALRVQGDNAASTGLYKIDLTTGAATLVGPINHGSPLHAIAVEP